jgi:succinate dehydrogenase/fumarate reductase flavoprotein subunit
LQQSDFQLEKIESRDTRATNRLFNAAAGIEALQGIMQEDVGPFRTEAGLVRAIEKIDALRAQLFAGESKPREPVPFDTALVDQVDLGTMSSVARCVATAALARRESRGAHQREDYPGMDEHMRRNQVLSQAREAVQLRSVAVPA